MTTQARRIAIALAVVLVGVELAYLVHAQAPRVYYDTQVYFEAAARPLGLERFFLGKPAFVPVVYTLTGPSPDVIATVQAVLAFVAWGALAAALITTLRRAWLRVLAGALCAAFVLAAPRVGYASAILSESINDSLAALLLACVLMLARATNGSGGRRRIALAVTTGAVALAWIFTRDSNAVAALAAVGAATLVWPVRRWWRQARWAVALAAVVSAGATFSLYSTRVAPAPLPYQATWNPTLTARGTYPMIDNVLWRVLVTDRAWLAARGAPVDELARFTEIDHALQARPEYAGFQAWLLAHGQGRTCAGCCATRSTRRRAGARVGHGAGRAPPADDAAGARRGAAAAARCVPQAHDEPLARARVAARRTVAGAAAAGERARGHRGVRDRERAGRRGGVVLR